MLAYVLQLIATDYEDNTFSLKEIKHTISNIDDLLKLEAECDRLNEELQRELSNVTESDEWSDDGLCLQNGELSYDGFTFASDDDIKWELARDRKNDTK